MIEAMLAGQHASLVEHGERIKKEQPSVTLIPAIPDRKKRRQFRKRAKWLKRKKG
jgi:hypothetical protein